MSPKYDGPTLHPDPAARTGEPEPVREETAGPGEPPETGDPLPEAGGGSQLNGDRPFPLQKSTRYQPLKWIKDGGMGSVWRAYSNNLKIEVALKFVRGGDPEHTKDILAEGQNMARVDHERVVKVLEVGEEEGQAFIAMQYVEGETLGNKAPHLTIEQKVLLLRDVALGVQAVHGAGLIHRDIKPANIMVKDSSEGLKPYLVDFGVARTGKVAANETGKVIGTPEYMSPEQARGEVASLDRRADVYGLGATLYALLAGRPPYEDEDESRLLEKVRREKPASPREIDPNVPEDLAAISLKCLENDRSYRYESARAFADDLDRYLRGDPVQARTGTLYRWRLWLRKHRVLVFLGAVVVLALGLAVAVWLDSLVREELARRFTERVERIESQARDSGLAPLHDLRQDREALRERMDELAAEIRKGGSRAVGPGHYAVGRGYLALGDHVKARGALEAAWTVGFQEPRVAYAMVLALGREYQERLTEAQRIQEEGKRRAKVAQVRERYTGQVLSYLARSKGVEAPSQEYLEALLAFYERRYDSALSQLAAIEG
ncbi:MAG TPA: serine/threonine-protein kinase, partial [Myxococcales bacterium]|nr:serine/threonine-protein kinase [Myxococcales bacterium]